MNFIPAANKGSPLGRFSGLSLFPPAWVFSIWIPIWVLGAMFLVRSFGSGLWTSGNTLVYVLLCVGNAGSQLVGARNGPWFAYLPLITLMFVGAALFVFRTDALAARVPFLRAASQLYLGWASLAVVVGLGVVLVCDLRVVTDARYTAFAGPLLLIVPAVLITLTLTHRANLTFCAAPYALVLAAFALRAL